MERVYLKLLYRRTDNWSQCGEKAVVTVRKCGVYPFGQNFVYGFIHSDCRYGNRMEILLAVCDAEYLQANKAANKKIPAERNIT